MVQLITASIITKWEWKDKTQIQASNDEKRIDGSRRTHTLHVQSLLFVTSFSAQSPSLLIQMFEFFSGVFLCSSPPNRPNYQSFKLILAPLILFLSCNRRLSLSQHKSQTENIITTWFILQFFLVRASETMKTDEKGDIVATHPEWNPNLVPNHRVPSSPP